MAHPLKFEDLTFQEIKHNIIEHVIKKDCDKKSNENRDKKFEDTFLPWVVIDILSLKRLTEKTIQVE